MKNRNLRDVRSSIATPACDRIARETTIVPNKSSEVDRIESPQRSAWQWALKGVLAFSLLINLALGIKIVVFDLNYPFRPICNGGRHIGFIVYQKEMGVRFQYRVQTFLPNSRVSNNFTLYISYRDWLLEKKKLWEASRSAAEYVHKRQYKIKRMTDQERKKLQTGRCAFIRKYALRKPQFQ